MVVYISNNNTEKVYWSFSFRNIVVTWIFSLYNCFLEPQQCDNVIVALRYTLYWRENGLTAITVKRTTANITLPGESQLLSSCWLLQYDTTSSLHLFFLWNASLYHVYLTSHLPSSIFDQKIFCSVCQRKWNLSTKLWQSRLKQLPNSLQMLRNIV